MANARVDITAYGGKGDGVTDNLTAYAAALAALPQVTICGVATTVGSIYFPPGAYAFSATVQQPAYVTLIGQSFLTTSIVAAHNTVGIGPPTGSTARRQGCGIHGLALVNGTGYGMTVGIDCVGWANGYMSWTSISGCTQKGLWLHGATNGDAVYNDFFHVAANTTAGQVKFHIDGLGSNENRFRSCYAGIKDFTLNSFTYNNVAGIRVSNCNHDVFFDNSIEGTTTHGVAILVDDPNPQNDGSTPSGTTTGAGHEFIANRIESQGSPQVPWYSIGAGCYGTVLKHNYVSAAAGSDSGTSSIITENTGPG